VPGVSKQYVCPVCAGVVFQVSLACSLDISAATHESSLTDWLSVHGRRSLSWARTLITVVTSTDSRRTIYLHRCCRPLPPLKNSPVSVALYR